MRGFIFVWIYLCIHFYFIMASGILKGEYKFIWFRLYVKPSQLQSLQQNLQILALPKSSLPLKKQDPSKAMHQIQHQVQTQHKLQQDKHFN